MRSIKVRVQGRKMNMVKTAAAMAEKRPKRIKTTRLENIRLMKPAMRRSEVRKI